jgi:hypothetical protein
LLKTKKVIYLQPFFRRKPGRTGLDGAVAQSVEQRTENPCVGGSIPPHTTKRPSRDAGFFISDTSLIVKAFQPFSITFLLE